MRFALGILCAFAVSQAFAQAGFPPPPPKVSPAAGVIDMHVHSHPDVFGRNMDDIDVAQLARSKGMRGILLKNHVAETASRAALVMKVVPGIEVWGGVVLNKAVGGINPDAVEWMHRVYGGRGKVVWLPTFESDKHVKTFSKPDAKGLVVAPGGKVTPEMEAILTVDTTRGNRVINRRGFAISPTVKDGWILRVSEDLLDIQQIVTGRLPAVFPLTMQDITPYGNGLYHLNSILQPSTATEAPVVGVALTAASVVPGSATGASHATDIDQAVRFSLEVAKAFGKGECRFYDPAEWEILQRRYGAMTHLQTPGTSG